MNYRLIESLRQEVLDAIALIGGDVGALVERVERLEEALGEARAVEGLEALVARVGMLEGRVEALRLLLVPLLK